MCRRIRQRHDVPVIPDTGKKSTGLGLNFVREVAKSHGGTISVTNRPEGGALAVLTLPRR